MSREEQIAEARKLRADGMSYASTARIVGIPCSTLRRKLNPEALIKSRVYARAHARQYREANQDKIKAYRDTHKDEAEGYHQKYREVHKAEIKLYELEYRKTHKEQIQQNWVEYYKAHKEELVAKAATYSVTHKEAREAWRQKNLDKLSAYTAARRALKVGALIGATSNQRAEIREIYQRAQEEPRVRCYLCGKLIPKGHRHVDHIVPLSKGGAHRPSNLAVACAKCNMRKNAKMPNEVGVLI